MPNSVQLPDLLSLCRAFELRTNRHCRTVTSASEHWFTAQQDLMSDTEKAGLRFMKIGLWASVCFPTCDPPQLRLATDFLTALVLCNCRLAQARTLRDCGWTDEQFPGGLSCLSGNILFCAIVQQLADAMPSESSRQRFNRSAEAFRTAQMQILSHRRNNTLPTLEAYTELRRDLSGIPMVFDLIEMTEGLRMPPSDHGGDSLKSSAADLIALSLDIFAYSNDQFFDNQFNLVSILRAHRGVSVQAALNHAFSFTEQAFQKFISTESALLSENTVPLQTTSLWAWRPFRPSSAAAPEKTPLTSDSKLYLRGLKDCIVGTLNWSYETELYFGSKGDEVRQFGWVFLKSREGGLEEG